MRACRPIPIFRNPPVPLTPSRCRAIVVAGRNARSTGTSCRRSAMSTTCRKKRRFVPAVVGGWTASARTSRGNWSCSRPSWKPISTSGRNTPAAAVRTGVCAARFPQRPIPGGIAGPGLIAEVIVSKFGDHLPLYRLEDIFARYGVYIPRSTLCDWVQCRRRTLPAAVRAATSAGPAIDGDVDGRYAGDGLGRPAREFSRPLLDLHWIRAALLGVRLHHESQS